jgi:excisionase family DNA binding protein
MARPYHSAADAVIAGILTRQERSTAHGHRFTANLVGNLRRHWGIPCFAPPAASPHGELVAIRQAAGILGVAPSSIHRWVNDGIIAGEQVTPGAPWRIRLTEELRARFIDTESEGTLTMHQATRLLGISRQTVLQRVKRGEIEAVHITRGKHKRSGKASPPSPAGDQSGGPGRVSHVPTNAFHA